MGTKPMFELCNIIRKLQNFMGIVSKHGNSQEAMTSFQGAPSSLNFVSTSILMPVGKEEEQPCLSVARTKQTLLHT
jgi:hypothetical protein